MPVADATYGSLPFAEAIAFFRSKLNLGTRAWTDLWRDQHDHAFVVAGAMKAELVEDFRNAVDKAIAGGTTLEAFRRDFDSIVAQHGWAYKGGRNWRTRVIYDTNLRTAYQAGRFKQLSDPDLLASRPYWRYQHSDLVQHPREEHLALDGLVLRHDDPFWQTWFPPNGWGCRCSVHAESERTLRRLGKDGPDQAPQIEIETRTVGARGPSPRIVEVPKGIDPGWDYTPGRSWMRSQTPPLADFDELLPSSTVAAAPADALPAPRPAPVSRVMPDDLPPTQYVEAFLAEFGIAEGERKAIFEDVTGELLVISDDLFRAFDGTLKIGKRDRARYVRLYADTIKAPDEVWVDFAEHGGREVLRRRYIARWALAESAVNALAVFEVGPAGWVGVTAFDAGSAGNLQTQARLGERVWKREK